MSTPVNWCPKHAQKMSFEEGYICWECEVEKARKKEREEILEYMLEWEMPEDEVLENDGFDPFTADTVDILTTYLRDDIRNLKHKK